MSRPVGKDGPSLTVDIDGVSPCVVKLGGELDASNADTLDERLHAVLATRPDCVVFDLSELRFVDSSGIGLFLRVARQIAKVVIRQPSTIVRQVLEHMGLAEVLVLEPVREP
jgi:anti-anti-sigma factor